MNRPDGKKLSDQQIAKEAKLTLKRYKVLQSTEKYLGFNVSPDEIRNVKQRALKKMKQFAAKNGSILP